MGSLGAVVRTRFREFTPEYRLYRITHNICHSGIHFPMSSFIKSLLMVNDSESSVSPGASHSAQTVCLHLLVSIKEKTDFKYWVRYTKRLTAKNTQVKINLLHVIEPDQQKSDSHSFLREMNDKEDGRSAVFINEVSQHLRSNGIPYRAYIRQGDVGSAIVDAAEMLDCHAIVLPEKKSRYWNRFFSPGIIRKVVNSSRSVPVVIVDADGIAKVWRD